MAVVVASMTGRRRRRLVIVVAAVLMLLLSVLTTTAAAARPLDGEVDGWVVAATGGGRTLPGGGPASIVETLRRLYRQQLSGSGPSCTTYSPNNSCLP
ncbi:hypothetical protein ABZP36_021311 [Zizania latifolia]